jgi:putative membrane protein
MAAAGVTLARFGPPRVKEEARAMDAQMHEMRVQAAERASETVRGESVSESRETVVSMGVHVATGAFGGAVYGAAAELNERVTRGKGSAFGTAFWAASRNVGLPGLGLAPPVTQSTFKDEAKGLSMHLLYGVVAESVREPVRRVMA